MICGLQVFFAHRDGVAVVEGKPIIADLGRRKKVNDEAVSGIVIVGQIIHNGWPETDL